MSIRFITSLLLCLCGSSYAAQGQCKIAFDEVDKFDKTRLVGAETVAFGYLVPSLFETANGPRMVEEGRMLFTYSEHDSISSFFMTLFIPEFNYQSIEKGFNVLLKLAGEEDEIVGLYNVPDQGTFDKTLNMRLYEHTCVMPLDMFYRLAFSKIELIRIVYKNQKRTFTLSPEQQTAMQQAMHCVGKQVGLYPVKP